MFLHKFTKSLTKCLVKQPQAGENGESDTNLLFITFAFIDRKIANCRDAKANVLKNHNFF